MIKLFFIRMTLPRSNIYHSEALLLLPDKLSQPDQKV